MKTRIFVVRRLGGDSLVLHPFGAQSDFFTSRQRRSAETQEQSGVEVLFREIPGPSESAAIRPALETAMQNGLREWLLDRGFIPRVALCSGVFLVLYLFFSIVVRDPVPVLDEFSIGAIGTVVAWKMLSSRALGSSVASATVTGVLKELETASYRNSGAVAWFEDRLAELDAPTPPDILHWLESPAPHPDPTDREDLTSLRDAFARHLCRSTFFGPENPGLIKGRARSALGLDRPLGRKPGLGISSGKAALYALYLKTCEELGG